MNRTRNIRIIVAIALAASMVVAGASLSSLLKQQSGYAAPQTKKQEQSTIESLRGNLAKRSAAGQHSDQENQFLRASGKCNNAALSEQTLGNDNSVTGFTDQSKNVPAEKTVTPSPIATPTPTRTPIGTPPPTTGTLFVIKSCIQCLGLAFSITVTGNNPQPSSFTLSNGEHQAVTLGPGSFTVTETPGFTAPVFSLNCKQTAHRSFSATGTISAGQRLFCLIENRHP
jgi:hypothetical protein